MKQAFDDFNKQEHLTLFYGLETLQVITCEIKFYNKCNTNHIEIRPENCIIYFSNLVSGFLMKYIKLLLYKILRVPELGSFLHIGCPHTDSKNIVKYIS